MRNPWVGLRPFTSSESDLFFGRRREAQILGNLVATQAVLVLYAPSGTGKSSLLNAGLVPAIRHDESQVAVVVGNDQDPMEALRSALAQTGWRVPPELGLAELMNEFWLDQDRRTIVIIDQFEERINAGHQLEDLYAAMTKLSHSRSDAGCVLLSIREDYIGALEPLMRRIPGLMDGSYRVPPLSRVALESAIYGPLRTIESTVSVSENLVRQSLDDLFQRSNLSQEPGEQRFEPGYFQIVWQRLWDDNAQRGGHELTLERYRKLGGATRILKDFTSGILNGLEPAQAQMFWAISRYLVLPTGAKTSLTVDDLTQLLQPSDYVKSFTQSGGGRARSWLTHLSPHQTTRLVRQVLQRLTSSQAPLFQRVIRSDREEYELLHDLLGKILLEWRREYEEVIVQQTSRVATDLQESLDRMLHGLTPGEFLSGTTEPSDEALEEFMGSSADYITHFGRELRDGFRGSTTREIDAAVDRAVMFKIVGDTVMSGNMSLRYEMRRRLSEHGASYGLNTLDFIRVALEHPRDDVRRKLQSTAPYLVETPTEYTPRKKSSPLRVAFGVLVGAFAAVASFAAAYAISEGIFSVLEIQYPFLTISILALLYTAVYAGTATDEASARNGAIAVFAPFLRPGRGLARLRRGLMTWPLPALYLTLFCLLGAWLFGLAGWAPTAGFNLAALPGLFGMALLSVWAYEA